MKDKYPRITLDQARPWEDMSRDLRDYYTVESAAEDLGVKRVTVYRLLAAGNLEGGKTVDAKGRVIQVLINRHSLERYIEWRDSQPKLQRKSSR